MCLWRDAPRVRGVLVGGKFDVGSEGLTRNSLAADLGSGGLERVFLGSNLRTSNRVFVGSSSWVLITPVLL